MNLPATIPGLLRRGSPVHSQFGDLVVTGFGQGQERPDCACDDSGYALRLHTISLDLGDRTGRIHAEWWLGRHGYAAPKPSRGRLGWRVARALAGLVQDLDPDTMFGARRLDDGHLWSKAEALRRCCLHVALTRYPDHPAVNDWRKALETP